MNRITEAAAAKFTWSCSQAIQYPTNLIQHDTYEYTLHGYYEHLTDQQKRIFVEQAKASLCVRDYNDTLEGFENHFIRGNFELQGRVVGKKVLDRSDPQWRFVYANQKSILNPHFLCSYWLTEDIMLTFSFIHAPHSRERLLITHEMFSFVLTYHQVMPAFLDFLFSFGNQKYAQDFPFGGFRSEERLSDVDRGLELPQLGRSGRSISVCYNLKSAEPVKRQKEWPWSVRITAMYHSFDVVTGKAFWIIIKGGHLIRERLEAATQNSNIKGLGSLSSIANSFSLTLQMHLVVFNWCQENWRWFINFLEQEMHTLTRETLLVDLEPLSCHNDNVQNIEVTPTIKSNRLRRFRTSASEKLVNFTRQIQQQPQHSNLRQPSHTSRPDGSCRESHDSKSTNEEVEFSFDNLQTVQLLEEKTNETILVLETNICNLSEAKLFYREIISSEGFPGDLRTACASNLSKFERKIRNIITDLQLEQARARTLLRLLTDRKNLLYGILEYRNMESNKLLAQKTQLSTGHMEALTQDMHEIARKTKQETVSMRIITLVTLFFLPGTFISTLMSTDILQYTVTEDGKSQEIFQLRALRTFLAITLPIMFLTFSSWYGVYWFINRGEKAAAKASKPELA